MTPNEYQQLAARTECNQMAALMRASKAGTKFIRLNHAAVGLGDVGEFCSGIEKWIYYGQDLDEDNLKEELGDIIWYIALACNALGVTMEEVMEANIRKLRQRYPEKFEESLAAEENRDREAEREAMSSIGGSHLEIIEAANEELKRRRDDRTGHWNGESKTELEEDREKDLGRLDRYANHLCPNCKTPVSDELLRKMDIGELDKGVCPECMKKFRIREVAINSLELISYAEDK